MPGLCSTKHIVSSRQITATVDEALAKLEPDAMITMNPVVHSFTRVPDQSIAAPDSKYRIVDRLAFLGTHFDTTYEAVFHPRADGLDIEVSAGMGTRLKTTWTVRGVGEGTVEVTEDVNVRVSLRGARQASLTMAQAFCALMPFISGTLQKSHRETMDRLVAAIQKR
jgi:hypothetical protein